MVLTFKRSKSTTIIGITLDTPHISLAASMWLQCVYLTDTPLGGATGTPSTLCFYLRTVPEWVLNRACRENLMTCSVQTKGLSIQLSPRGLRGVKSIITTISSTSSPEFIVCRFFNDGHSGQSEDTLL